MQSQIFPNRKGNPTSNGYCQHSSHLVLENSTQNPTFCSPNLQDKKIIVAMEILKQAILKPNMALLSKSQNTILEQCLNQFLSNLVNSTPDHPPYAWMIQRALEELNEEGGSSEDSISKFIKKEYDNLPWAHNTLLKHHLQKLSESGEILMIDGGHFLLARGNKSLNPKRKSKRKHMKRKRGWDWDIKQKKRRKKEKKEKQSVVQDVEVVEEQKKLDEQQNGMREKHKELNGHHNEQSTEKEDGQLNLQQNHITGDEVLCRGDQRIRVYKQKGKQQSDATEGPLRSSIASESDIGSSAGFVPIEPLRVIMTEAIEHSEDLELQHQNFSLSGVEEAANICNSYPQGTLENEQPGDNLPQILSPEAPPGFEFVAAKDATANKADNSASVGLDSLKEGHVVHQGSERPAEDQAPIMDNGSDALKRSKGSQVIELAVVEPSSENKQQLAELSKMEGSQDTELAVAEPSLGKQQQLTELSKMEVSQDYELAVVEPSSEKQQQLTDLSKMEGSQVIELAVVEPSSEKQQLAELSKMEGSQDIALAVVEPSSEKQQQLEEWKSTPEKLNKDEEPFYLLLQRPREVEAVTIEKSPQTDRAQRQLKRWGRNQCEPKPDTSTTLQLETSEQVLSLTGPQHEVHLELRKHPRRGRSSQNKEDGAKVCTSTMSPLATNEVLSSDDPELHVQLKQLKRKRLGRPPKSKEDGGKPGSTISKNLGVSKKLKKNQNGQGRGRSRKGQ